MFVTTRRASAWLDAGSFVPGAGGEDHPGRRESESVVVRHAVRPLQTAAGRCTALKQVVPAGRPGAPRHFVLFESRYERSPRPRWVPLERVLDEADIQRWLKDGFR